MNVRQAFSKVLRDYGVKEFAEATGGNKNTLQCKANPNDSSHEPLLREAVDATVITRSPLIAIAFCELAGGIFVPTASLANKSVPELYKGVHDVTRELGDVLREIDEGMKDGRITPTERDRIKVNIFELIEKAAALGKRVDSMADAATLKAVK